MSDIFQISLDELVRGKSQEYRYVVEREDEKLDPWEEKWLGIRKKNWCMVFGFWIAFKMLYFAGTRFFQNINYIYAEIFQRAQNILGTNGLAFTFKEFNKGIFLAVILELLLIFTAIFLLRVLIEKNDMNQKINKGIFWICWYGILYGSSILVIELSFSLRNISYFPINFQTISTHVLIILAAAAILIWKNHRDKEINIAL